jgi:HK97 family phage major capsid protein
MTILGKFGTGGIPSLRNVPFRVPLISQTAGASGYWVGEAKAKPLTSITGARTTLTPLKVANICVLTEEVIRDSSPKAEVIIRDELAAALRERLDTDFIDPAKAASSNVSPASITNSSSLSSNSSGTDATAVFHDIKLLMAEFMSHNNPPSNGVWIMSNTNAMSLAMMQNPLGQPWFPTVSMNGGQFFGIPIIASEYADDNVVLVNASDVYFADEGDVTVDMSRDASLEMSDAPRTIRRRRRRRSYYRCFKQIALRCARRRTVNWALRRASGVAFLTTVNWGGHVSDMTV